MSVPHLARLEGVIQPYAWGSRTVLAELRQRPAPTDRPEAELWFGGHPRGPARILDGPSPLGLDAFVARDPRAALGVRVMDRFGPRLPLLLKVLAIDSPLSLQVHPSQAQAETGFAREEAAGIPRDAPDRNYRDPRPKPELLLAHTPVEALAGFRRASDIATLLQDLRVPLLDPIQRLLARKGDDALREAVARLLTWSTGQRGVLVGEVARRAAELAAQDHPDAAHLRWLPHLHRQHHQDPGVVVTLLLQHLRLAPGEAIFLPAGNIHAYLSGTAIECMADSDNVLRGGLTTKHVDVPELLSVLDARPADDLRITPEPIAGGLAYPVDNPWFALQLLTPDGDGVALDDDGPQVLLALGDVEVADADRHVALSAGHGAFVPACATAVRARGRGTLVRATVGR